jgi:protein-L-isoaspartate(D-aspartate) O-methyltransferase
LEPLAQRAGGFPLMNKPLPRRGGFPLRLDQLNGPSGRVGVTREGSLAPERAVLRPQAPLQHAASSAARGATPSSGHGLDSAGVRLRLVERLRQGGLRDEAVCAALAAVPRHLFVDSALVPQAYEDTSLPIGHGQTISKPSVVARMIELLMAGSSARAQGQLGNVLEIGTGCGYQAAVLAHLARRVVSVERLLPLHEKARAHLDGLPQWRPRVRLVHGDGMLGHPPNAPYDAIIAAAGGDALPSAWLEQLALGGRLVAPVQDAGGRQSLVVVDRSERGYERSVHEGVFFVPLKSGLVR